MRTIFIDKGGVWAWIDSKLEWIDRHWKLIVIKNISRWIAEFVVTLCRNVKQKVPQFWDMSKTHQKWPLKPIIKIFSF